MQLTGTLPAFLSEIESLTELEVESNKVYSHVCTLSAITLLHGSKKPTCDCTGVLMQMTGTIPAALGSLVNLTALKLENNVFHGTLPTELG